MDERFKFLVMYLEHEWGMAWLCRRFGISRKTGYKWVSRFIENGPEGLRDRSRSPLRHRFAVSEGIIEAVVAARRAHPTWGPRKLRAWLKRHYPDTAWPAASTIGEILRRHGLTVPRRRSRKGAPYTEPLRHCDRPNAVWSADFKGWFITGDGRRCDPLTITDNYSRYLLRCQAVKATGHELVQLVFEAAFREYGLPDAIRTDNGPPFATTTVGGLSRLSIWWLRLGIMPERIEPGQPAQNGRHERMHRTLKRDTASPPKRTRRRQQEAFDSFRQEYNCDRPHESIDDDIPANRYYPSRRPYPLVVPEMTYADHVTVRWVHSQGDIRWHNRQIYLSQTLAGEPVGLIPTDNDRWDIYFGPIKLAVLDSANKRLIHLPKTRRATKRKQENVDYQSEKVLPMSPV
jgi:transposase InsO family protein